MISLYGNFRTRKFTDVWDNAEDWLEEYLANPLAVLSEDAASMLFYLLYGRYGNSHIASSDENQFKYKLYGIIFQYGPAWEKRLDIQKKIRELSDEEIERGSRQVSNHAYNPSTEPTTASLDELNYINEQNTVGQKKSKLDAYGNVLALLETDVTEEFIGKFKKLFLTVVQPEIPLWYVSEEDEMEDEE